MKKQFKILIVSLLLVTLLFPKSIVASRLYSIVTDQEVSNPVYFGLQQLESVIFKKKYQIERTITLEESAGDIILIAGISSSPGTAARLLKELDNKLPDKPESFIIHRYQQEGKPLIVMCGADQNGLMYAIMEVAERLGWSDNPNDLLQYVNNVYSEPEIPDRSVSMYTMQRAWFEQRLYDEDYWVRYFEMLAKSRINRFVMIFGYENGGFLAPPYPYFFDVEEYPDIRMVGITKTEQKKNTDAINRIIELAHDRGIKFVPGIWDHIYRGGVQSGGVKGKEKTPETPEHGLVWGLHADNLAGYTKVALRKFLKVFPDIDGIHFRMHGESGLKRNEIPVFWHEVFQLIKEERPSVQVEIRAKGLPDEVIEDAINQGLNFRVSTKYWMEQMGLPFHPTHINKQNQHDRRHGYADLLKYPQKYRVHWRLWNGGTARILLWGDPEYVRRFVASTKLYNGNSFEVNEPLATKMEAQSHDLKPFELINPGYRYYEYEFERYWYFFQLFGRIGYDPDISGEVWINQFTSRFGEEAGMHLMKGLHLGSRILPMIIAAAYRYRYFPTTRGWPEKMRMDDLPLFATAEGSDIQQFLNFMEEADLILESTETPKRRPFETSCWFREISDSILREVTNAEKSIKDLSDKEFISTVTDLKILAYLSRYYSLCIPAAVYYNLFLKTGDLYALENAIMQEENAIQAWSKLVRSAGKVYNDNLMMGICHGNMCGHWRDELKMLEEGIKSLKHNRDSIISIMHLSDIIIAHVPVRKVRPGEMLSINATITGESKEIAVRCAVKLNAGEYTWHEVKPVDCFRYQLELPTPSNEGELFYYIEVTKNNDKLLTFPDQALEDHIITLINNDFQPPDVIIHPVGEVKPGTDVEVLVEANDISGLKWVRLRYRHVTQFEDYLTLEMEYDPVRKAYKAQIPGDFIVPEWDLMFFVEVLDNKGNGRMYPDFEKEQPYVIVEPVRNN